jgi:aryl-alcohol dehydrogenase-like predicted oxidoreductase
LSAERAVVSGITYFDKAASYGDGLSETNLLRDLRAEEQVKVGTKIRVSGEEIGRIEELTVSSSEVSPKCLGREQIDLMQPMDYPDALPSLSSKKPSTTSCGSLATISRSRARRVSQ